MKITEWFLKRIKRKEAEEKIQDDIVEEPAKVQQEEPREETVSFKKQRVNMEDAQERRRYVTDCCEQMLEASNETENAKLEYNLVTAYLHDMQMIEDMPEDRKRAVNSTVRKILNLLIIKIGSYKEPYIFFDCTPELS